MRYIYAIILLLFSIINLDAQEQKQSQDLYQGGNTATLGFDTNFSKTTYKPKGLGAESEFIDFRLNASPGYYLGDQLVLIMDIGIHFSKQDRFTGETKNINAIFGPVARYYFDGEPIAPFISAGYLFERGKNDGTKTKGNYISLGCGGSFMVGNNIALEAELNYNFGPYEDRYNMVVVDYKYRQTLLRIGARYFFE